jgi:methylated-DNA-[protein]-cysteine S-methyltransferase
MNTRLTNTQPLYRRTLPSPIGTINVIATSSSFGTSSDAAIAGILWDTDAEISDGAAHNPVERQFSGRTIIDAAAGDHDVLDRAIAQLEEYFAGERLEFDLPLEPGGTAFQQQAWATLRTIPFGETMTYGEQAAEMGDARKARAVGSANGQNPIPIVVPCHRVIGSTGKLTGFAGGLGVKAWLLEHERFTLMRQ